MKKLFLITMTLIFGVSVMARQKIQLRSADRAECVNSDMRSLRASFSFSSIDAQDMQTERGTFSWLSLPNTVIGGNEGTPQIPVVNELIAVPFGANPRIEITSYSTTDYRLEDYGIHTLVPRQPAAMKNQNPEFVYNEAAYQTRGMRSEPMVRVSVNGTMRGVQVGQLSIEPVSYDPVSNILRVFNDIEVTVHFDGADARATEDMLVSTYSPYFDVLYKQLFNGRAIRDVYDEHPDLWKSPVRMLVIANRMFESCIQDWVAWKTLKGIYVDVNYTDVIGTSADAIKSFIQNKYAQDAPTFLMIMGDEDQVPPSITSASMTSEVSDLYYSSVDGDQFVDMFHSRFSAETTAQMTAMLNKSLEYEQYTMPDPSYLNNVLLIAGHDTSGWGVTVGRPTIWYATNYYYNAEHGFDNVYEYTTDDYTNCYAPLNSGVGFANYTAHGAKTAWADPQFSVDDVANMTNEHKYFFAIGNCCITGDWGYSTPCFGEALTRAENKGAFAYIGSCPNTVWLNDYYFGVGPTSRADGTMPTYEETGTGIYDAIWMDDVYNTVNSILYVGNLAGNAAEALGYTMHRDPLYYWQAYHVLGDGSVMPYRVQPTANQVSHMAILPIGMATYEVSAVPGSYVAISKDGVLLGVALVGATGTVQVPITPVTSGGDVTICVTAPNRIPYIQTVPAAALEGPYISVDSYTPTTALVGENTNLSITFKNVGTDATSGTTTVTLTSNDANVTINGTGSFGTLAPDATTTVNGFSFSFSPGIALGAGIAFHYVAVNGSDTWEGNITISPDQIFTVGVAANDPSYGTVSGSGQYHYGESCTVNATPANGFMFTSWTLNEEVVSTDAAYTFRVTSDMDLVANFALAVMIGGGGTSTSSYLPSYNYYNYSLTQQIYTIEELGTPGRIMSISFYNDGAEKTRTYDFYMKSTTKSAFSGGSDWETVTEADKVFSGVVTMVSGDWTTITLDNPFLFDGSANILLVADDNSGGYTNSPHMACRVFNASNQALYIYSDGTNYDPASPSSYNGTRLGSKNQIILTKESLGDCVRPTGLTATEVGPDFVKLSWAENGASEEWVVVCNGNSVTANTNEGFILDELDPETEYTITVYPACDENLVSAAITITTLEACPAPQNVDVSNNTGYTATVTWGGYNDSYLVQLGIPAFLITENFDNGVPANWANDATYPWTIVNGYMQSGNAGIESSSSSISVTVTYPADGTISFDFWSRGEGQDSNDWDNSRFYIDNEQMFRYGAHSNWESYSTTVTAGTHIFTWTYKKDSSVNPDGDCFIIDNVEMKSGEIVWNDPVAVENAEYTFRGLTPETTYCVRVLGVCDDVETEWCETVMFTTNEITAINQTYELSQGTTWWSTHLDIALDDLKAAIEVALGANGTAIIKSQSTSIIYSNGMWIPEDIEFDIREMYKIQVSEACEITLTGVPVNTSEEVLTINPGNNWIGFPSGTSMTLGEAFAGLNPVNGDVVKSQTGSSVYNDGNWIGTVGSLEPGQGYLYYSKATSTKTFNF